MQYDIELLPQAWEELIQIQDYYTLEFGNATGYKVRQQIIKTISQLSEFPDSGTFPPDEWLADNGYRMVICKKHIAIYKKFEGEKKIYIYHIANARMQYDKLFQNN